MFLFRFIAVLFLGSCALVTAWGMIPYLDNGKEIPYSHLAFLLILVLGFVGVIHARE